MVNMIVVCEVEDSTENNVTEDDADLVNQLVRKEKNTV